MGSRCTRTCQSCGMPMDSEDDFGTEADGALSDDYCTHCYQNGAFTEPDITIDGMAKVCGAIMSQLYAIPQKKAEEFSREQLSCLKRWAGREVAVCGSCGMPLLRDEDAGTEADGSPSAEYCTYCYRDGAVHRARSYGRAGGHEVCADDGLKPRDTSAGGGGDGAAVPLDAAEVAGVKTGWSGLLPGVKGFQGKTPYISSRLFTR